MYLTYDEFVNMGGTAEAASFNRMEHKARAIIDLMTFERVRYENPVRDAVKYACFDLIQAMQAEETTAANGGEIASVSNDGVSITYAAAKSAGARQKEIIRGWLGAETTDCGVPLLYAGVSVT